MEMNQKGKHETNEQHTKMRQIKKHNYENTHKRQEETHTKQDKRESINNN